MSACRKHVVLLACILLLCTQVSYSAVPNYVLGTPSATRVTDTSLHINVRLDTQGFFYFVILPRGDPAPVAGNVKDGKNAEGGEPIVKGFQQVTTTTLTFTEIVYQKLNLSTAYDIYVVAEDDNLPPNTQPVPSLVQFKTLEGRKLFQVGRGGRENNRLGLGDVVDHWTPHAVPAWDNVTVNKQSQYTDILLKWGHLLRIGDVWNGRMTLSTQNEHYTPNNKEAWLSAGGNHWLGVLDRHGRQTCLSFGKNDHGRLGLGDEVEHLTATEVPGFERVELASAGLEFSLLVNASRLFTFGRNDVGQLGLNDTVVRWTPTLVEGYNDVSYASAGRDHVLFINSGQMYSMGSNRFGQLGVGDTIDRWTPVAVPKFNRTDAVVAGNYYSLAVQDRQVYSFGYNFQTGGSFNGYSPHNIKCYEQHSAGCYDVGKPSPNLDDPDNPFNYP